MKIYLEQNSDVLSPISTTYINDFDIDNITDFFEKSIEIGNYVIAYQLKKLKLDVMFRSSKSIENIIKNRTFKAKTKLDMLLLVEWVSSHKSLKRKEIGTCSKSIVNKKLLKKFQQARYIGKAAALQKFIT